MIEIAGATLEWWQAILAVIVAVVGSARLTRVVTHDDYPPSIAVRIWWDKLTKDGPWSKLVHCHWCFGPWAALLAILSFLIGSFWPITFALWWLFWGWLTLSYWTSQYVHFDEGNDAE